jgi:4-amino-4-deoxy-L-arabinose transferase-like glycosyltransferase
MPEWNYKKVMEKRLSKIYPQKWVQILLLIGFCVVLYFVNLGQWDLWSPDEPRYAQVAKEMVARGDWILMHYNGKVYPDKPPLFFWLVTLSSYLWQGFNSFSVRFVPALFGTLTVLITFFVGKTLFSSRAGFLSGLVLATSFEFAYLSTRANMDTMLTFFTTGSLLCFFHWYRYPSPLPNGPAYVAKATRKLSIYGFYVGMAFATLAKGPVGFILPLLVGLFYLSVQKDWKAIKEMKLLPGLLLFVGIVLSWYLPALLRGGEDYLNLTLFKHTISRYSEGWSKPRPFYYYLYNFPIDFLPWILFLPAAIVYGYSREMIEKRREFFFILLWFALIFIFFSSSKGKRSLYLLPLYPTAALLVGKLWDDFISTPMDHFRHEWISFPLYGFMGLTLLAGASLPWVVSMKFPSYLLYSLPVAFLLVAGSIAIFFLYRFKNHGAIFCLIIGVIAAGFFYISRVVFPLVNPYKSSRFISQEITSRILPGEKLSVYGRVSAAPYNFYTGIVPIEELNTRGELLHFLESSERVFCLLPFKDFSQFQTKEGWPEVRLIARRKVGDIDIVLISNDSSGR